MRTRLLLSPAPDPKYGWQFLFYRAAWSQQLSAFVREHALGASLVTKKGEFVSKDENFPVWFIEGWQE